MYVCVRAFPFSIRLKLQIFFQKKTVQFMYNSYECVGVLMIHFVS